MLVFLLPLLIQRPDRLVRAGGPTNESHTHLHGDAGCSRWLSWFTRRELPSPLRAVPTARAEHGSSHLNSHPGVHAPGLGPVIPSGDDAHRSAGAHEIQREYPIEDTTVHANFEPFNGGPTPIEAWSLNARSEPRGRRPHGPNHAIHSHDIVHARVHTEKETD